MITLSSEQVKENFITNMNMSIEVLVNRKYYYGIFLEKIEGELEIFNLMVKYYTECGWDVLVEHNPPGVFSLEVKVQ